MKPFTINIDDTVIDTINERIKQTTWPLAEDDKSWSNGTSISYMKDVAQYWTTEYDWKKVETYLNSFSHYTSSIENTQIHYIFEESDIKDAPTLMLLHGWPDSFYRFHDVIAKFKKNYNVVVPSLPGFGFSKGAAKTSEETAKILHSLVTGILNKKEYFVAAGDTGAPVAIQLARSFPDDVAAMYLTDVGYDNIGMDRKQLSDVEKEYLGYLDTWMMSEGAYAMVHTTKPQSLAFALSDSPIGFAAWAASFANGGQSENYVDTAFGMRDNFITNMMIYLVTGTINSAMQTYREGVIHKAWGVPAELETCPVPVALTTYPNDTYIPKEWAERIGLNIKSYKQMAHGGHFAPMELPTEYAADVHDSFLKLV